MRIIKRSTLIAYGQKHPDAAAWLSAWITVVERAEWSDIADVREIYRHADAVRTASDRVVTIFNVKGNRYRLIVAVHYNTQRVYIREFLTHQQYDSQRWKRRH